jgi:hypothetical protein
VRSAWTVFFLAPFCLVTLQHNQVLAQSGPGQSKGKNTVEGGVEVHIKAYCEPAEPGVSVAEIQWPLGQATLTKAQVNNLVEQQVLDVTVFKDGFQRGLYTTVKPGVSHPEFQPFKAEQKAIPGLQNLKMTQFATTEAAPVQGLRLSMRPPAGQVSAIAKLQGMEPGMRYFVRLSSQNARQWAVSFTGPICPVDWVEPPKQ